MMEDGVEKQITIDNTSEAKEPEKNIQIRFHETYPSNLFWCVSQLASFEDPHSDKRYKEFWESKFGLSEEDKSQLAQFHEITEAITPTREDQQKLNETIFDQNSITLKGLSGKLAEHYGENGAKIAQIMGNFEVRFLKEYKPDYQIGERIGETIKIRQFDKLMGRFRNFLGHYALPEAHQRIFLLWSPDKEGGISRAEKPDLILHSPGEKGSDEEAGVVMHEIAHNQFDTRKGALAGEISARSVDAEDFDEGLVYALHYGIIEGDKFGHPGKLEQALNEPSRVNKTQIAFAQELLPMLRDYVEKGRQLDSEFLDSAKVGYERSKSTFQIQNVNEKIGKIDENLQNVLLALRDRDQKARKSLVKGELDPKIGEQTDRENSQKLKEIIEKYGWPGKSLVGDEGAQAAWLIAQHADHDVAFQEECLKLLEEAVKNNESSKEDLAYLTDRVKVNKGQPQIFGTQFIGTLDNIDTPQPIEDPEHLDERRTSMGMKPYREYLEEFKRNISEEKND